MTLRGVNLLREHKWSALLFLFILVSVPLMPVWLRWMVLGAMATYLVLIVIPSWFSPKSFRQLITIDDLRALFLPFSKATSEFSEADSDLFEAWFNEVDYYDPADGRLVNIRTVYVRLRRFRISLLTPERDLPKQATWNEQYPERPHFVSQRSYNIADASVYIGSGDADTWSSLTPICVQFAVQRNAYSDPDADRPPTLYLLARCDRDKETWYRLLAGAASGSPLRRAHHGLVLMNETRHKHRTALYLQYMGQVLPEVGIRQANRAKPQLVWINALTGRCTWDFIYKLHKTDEFRDWLQGWINQIKVASFLDPLIVESFNPGLNVPTILNTSRPYMDSHGLWIDIDLTYTGQMTLVLEVRCRWTSWMHSDSKKKKISKKESRHILGVSSIKHYLHGPSNESFLRRVLPNMKISIKIDLTHISGRFTINIPHPPTNTIWCGFRSNPTIKLKLNPFIRETNVKLDFIMNKIEQKLLQEVQRSLVLPHMTYLPVALMSDKPTPVFDLFTSNE